MCLRCGAKYYMGFVASLILSQVVEFFKTGWFDKVTAKVRQHLCFWDRAYVTIWHHRAQSFASDNRRRVLKGKSFVSMTWLCDLGSKVLHSNAGDNFLSNPINTFCWQLHGRSGETCTFSFHSSSPFPLNTQTPANCSCFAGNWRQCCFHCHLTFKTDCGDRFFHC